MEENSNKSYSEDAESFHNETDISTDMNSTSIANNKSESIVNDKPVQSGKHSDNDVLYTDSPSNNKSSVEPTKLENNGEGSKTGPLSNLANSLSNSVYSESCNSEDITSNLMGLVETSNLRNTSTMEALHYGERAEAITGEIGSFSSMISTDDIGSENSSHRNSNDSIVSSDIDENESSSSTDSFMNSDNEETFSRRTDKVEKYVREAMQKNKPKCQNVIRQLHLRENGFHKLGAQEIFTKNIYDSLFVAESMQLIYRLRFHDGCVNSLHFNDNGSLLVSGSDDLNCAIWSLNSCKPLTTFNSQHSSNIFQSKFAPINDSVIVTCAKDGHVRCIRLRECGNVASNVSLAKHRREANKVCFRPNNPNELLSCGGDATIKHIDIRDPKSTVKLLDVRNLNGKNVPLHSLSFDPANSTQFCVAGGDETVRIYDVRLVSGPVSVPVLKFTPDPCKDKQYFPSATSAVYSHNGDAILASYSDEEIYLFDTSKSDSCPPIHVYTGHRNSETIKAVSFFGPNSRYILSGSDCCHILCWDRETEAIVNFVVGDKFGAINVLEPHPHMPILAASGLDNDVKIFMPGGKKEVFNKRLLEIITKNFEERESERHMTFNPLNSILEFISPGEPSLFSDIFDSHLDILSSDEDTDDVDSD